MLFCGDLQGESVLKFSVVMDSSICNGLKDASSECTTAMFQRLKDGSANMDELKAHCTQVFSVSRIFKICFIF